MNNDRLPACKSSKWLMRNSKSSLSGLSYSCTDIHKNQCFVTQWKIRTQLTYLAVPYYCLISLFGCLLLLPYFLIWLFPTTALFPYLAVTVPYYCLFPYLAVPYYCLISLFGCSLLLPYFLIWLVPPTHHKLQMNIPCDQSHEGNMVERSNSCGRRT